jgi:hypothetical protein
MVVLACWVSVYRLWFWFGSVWFGCGGLCLVVPEVLSLGVCLPWHVEKLESSLFIRKDRCVIGMDLCAMLSFNVTKNPSLFVSVVGY